MSKLDDLNPNQRKFVAEYIVSGNATQAAIAAGYSAKTAGSQGERLLRHAEISGALAEARAKLEIKTEITQERVLAELALLAFSSVDHYEVDELGNVTAKADAPKGAMRAISSIKRKTFTTKDGDVSREVEIKLWDKPGPLKLAGKHVGLFAEKVEISTSDDKPIGIIIAGQMPVPPELAGGAAPGPETTTTWAGQGQPQGPKEDT